MSTRRLNQQEWQLAQQVFQRTLPYRAVRVSSRIGLGDRPFTLNYGIEDNHTYHLNVGTSGFGGLELTPYSRSLLIHELTHVWQSCHSVWPPTFIFNSLWHQTVSGGDAYKYTAGSAWDSYNVEQQASIVEDCFNGGLQPTGPLYPYVRDHLRLGKVFG
jgi:hypothetical protein